MLHRHGYMARLAISFMNNQGQGQGWEECAESSRFCGKFDKFGNTLNHSGQCQGDIKSVVV
jgi:hypothetical protein